MKKFVFVVTLLLVGSVSHADEVLAKTKCKQYSNARFRFQIGGLADLSNQVIEELRSEGFQKVIQVNPFLDTLAVCVTASK